MRCADCGTAITRHSRGRCRPCSAAAKAYQDAWSVLESNVRLDIDTGCWIWTGRHHGRYGQLTFRGRRCLAHHFAFWIWHGRWPEAGLIVMHSCDRPPCVCPVHVREGTHADNVRDMIAKGRAAWQQDMVEELARTRGIRYATGYPGR